MKSYKQKARLIAFYLPQFHPIPENDEWWGRGFTEWTNTRKAQPLFPGHYQPHIPAELGYYDLRDEASRIAQATLAAQYGISGFCYYHYWFNDKMLLETPFNEVLASGKPDFPFCLCWANENWTRRWDGFEEEVLIKQGYSQYDALAHIEWLEQAFRDNRYIKINNKPLIVIYLASQIPELKHKISLWRQFVNSKGYDGLYLCAVLNFRNNLTLSETMAMGFDAAITFQPNPINCPRREYPSFYLRQREIFNNFIRRCRLDKFISPRAVPNVYDYKKYIQKERLNWNSNYTKFPCVMPHWDNTARRAKYGGTVIQNDDETLYRDWLEDALSRVKGYPEDEQIVFINAWNEWAEGCYLEPDQRNGRKFLKATLDALTKHSQF